MNSHVIPNYDIDTVMIGHCVVLLDLYKTGKRKPPSIEVGCCDEAKIAISRELLDLKAPGQPPLLLQQWSTAESGTLTLKGWEWNISGFYEVYKNTVKAIKGDPESFQFGGDYCKIPICICLSK